MFLLTAAGYVDIIQLSSSSFQLVVLNDAVQCTLKSGYSTCYPTGRRQYG